MAPRVSLGDPVLLARTEPLVAQALLARAASAAREVVVEKPALREYMVAPAFQGNAALEALMVKRGSKALEVILVKMGDAGLEVKTERTASTVRQVMME
jgi:hypothetical protein